MPGCEDETRQPSGAVRMTMIRVGVDTSKHVFQIHGVDENEQPVLRRQIRRSEVVKFFAKLAPTRIGIEACGASHYWARLLRGLGHEVVLSRPGMRFVPIKTAEQQAGLTMLGAHDLLVKQRTMLINAIRGHAAEFGVTVAKGPKQVGQLLQHLASDEGVPALAREMIGVLASQLDGLEIKLKTIEKRLMAWHRQDQISQCLATIPGIGPISGVSFALKVADPKAFRSGRHFASWIGITPRENSTAGRQKLGRISRAGDEDLRRLLVIGATAVIHAAKPGRTAPWLLALLARKSKKLAAVALANKTARIVWAMMVSGETYRQPAQA